MSRIEFDRAFGVRTDGQIHMCPVNLDGLDTDTLRMVAEHPALHTSVRECAGVMVEARHYRAAGQIDRALRFERRVDRICDWMPSAVRW